VPGRVPCEEMRFGTGFMESAPTQVSLARRTLGARATRGQDGDNDNLKTRP
jgi:hypothetical protein